MGDQQSTQGDAAASSGSSSKTSVISSVGSHPAMSAKLAVCVPRPQRQRSAAAVDCDDSVSSRTLSGYELVQGEEEALEEDPVAEVQSPGVPHSTPVVAVRGVRDYFEVMGSFQGGQNACSVHRVRSKENGRAYALKHFSPCEIGQRMFKAEVSALQALSGLKGVVRLKRAMADSGGFYLVLELAPMDLFSSVKEEMVGEPEARHVVRRLLKTIGRMHALGYVHRDLKLENVVLGRSGNPKLIDFSDARLIADDGAYKDLVGTPCYMSPERWRVHKGWELKQSEVWAVGVMAFEMVTGERCFDGDTPEEIYRNVRRGKWSFPPIKLSDQFRDFVRSALEADPRKRPSVAECLSHPWLQALD